MNINKLTKAGLKARVEELELKLQEQAEETNPKNIEAFNLGEEIANLGYYERNWQTGKGFWSSGFYKLLGVQQGEVECTHEVLSEFFHHDDRERVNKYVRKALIEKKDMNVEFKLVQKNGNVIHVQGNGKTKYNDKGEPILTIGTFQDITERKHIENELIKAKEKAEENERRFRTLTENVPGTIYLCNNDEKYTMLYLNDSIERLTGYTKEEFLSQQINIADLFHPEDHKHIVDNVSIAIQKKDSYQITYRIKHKSGNWIWIEEFGAGVYEHNKLLFLEGILINITDRRKQEEELIKAKEKAEESDRLKSAFLANMSHEIRTPMNGIIGFSEMFLRSHFDDEKRNYYAQIVVDSSRQLLNIVDDILDISMIDSKSIKLIKRKVSINDLINEMFETFKPQFEKSGVSFHLFHDLKDEDSTVETDKERLKQVISKLLNNALKFTSKGTVKLGYECKANKLQFYVKDTGIGISPKNQTMIFERFQQVDMDSTRVYGGTGLGLTIAKNLVTLLGGDIWVESEKGKGSTFYFTIPYDPINQKTNRPNKTDNRTYNKNITVLVAEDEELNYMYIEELLSELDITLIHTKDGQETVKVCKENPFIDLVLMDLKMPIMDGLEATKKIKEFKPDLPIIAQTAYALAGDKEKAIKAGCNGYLAKPIDANELLNTVNKILNI